jgi:hypothetical protein
MFNFVLCNCHQNHKTKTTLELLLNVPIAKRCPLGFATFDLPCEYVYLISHFGGVLQANI